MSWRLVHLADVAPVPWRNGGGLTRELLAWPSAADWSVRLSVAEVGADGPFSRFEGVQRWFAVLAGQGVRLDVGGALHTLAATDAPFAFDGAATVGCRLVDGPTQDFNLMLKGRAGRMQRVAGQLDRKLVAMTFVAAYAGTERAAARFGTETQAIPPRTLAWRILPAGARVQLDGADVLWMESPR